MGKINKEELEIRKSLLRRIDFLEADNARLSKESYVLESNTNMSISDKMFPLYHCPKHDNVSDVINVQQGTDNDGVYCQICYVENVIIPNCQKVESESKLRKILTERGE